MGLCLCDYVFCAGCLEGNQQESPPHPSFGATLSLTHSHSRLNWGYIDQGVSIAGMAPHWVDVVGQRCHRRGGGNWLWPELGAEFCYTYRPVGIGVLFGEIDGPGR